MLWCSWACNCGSLSRPHPQPHMCLPPDFMREKWTQTVIGSLVSLYTCRLLRPHNCVIQVACQSCERSSQAHVDVGLMYIVERETKTAQPKWNARIVLGLQKGLCHTGPTVPSFSSPQRALPCSVCSANFGGCLRSLSPLCGCGFYGHISNPPPRPPQTGCTCVCVFFCCCFFLSLWQLGHGVGGRRRRFRGSADAADVAAWLKKKEKKNETRNPCWAYLTCSSLCLQATTSPARRKHPL